MTSVTFTGTCLRYISTTRRTVASRVLFRKQPPLKVSRLIFNRHGTLRIFSIVYRKYIPHYFWNLNGIEAAKVKHDTLAWTSAISLLTAFIGSLDGSFLGCRRHNNAHSTHYKRTNSLFPKGNTWKDQDIVLVVYIPSCHFWSRYRSGYMLK